MKTKLRFFLLFLCLLPMALIAQDEKKLWTSEEALTGIIINRETYSNQDVTVDAKNENYTVYTAKGLAWIAKVTNEGVKKVDGEEVTQYYPAYKGFELCKIEIFNSANFKIDLSAYYWEPIGRGNSYFVGDFNGTGHELTGLKIYRDKLDSKDSWGLFGDIAYSTITNLGVQLNLDYINIDEGIQLAYLCIGGIAGYINNSIIENCYASGKMNCEFMHEDLYNIDIGSIVGVLGNLSSSIKNCYSTVDIITNTNTSIFIGGIAGDNYGTIESCYATGSIKCIKSGNNISIGGIIGNTLDGTVKNCLALNKGGITIEGEGTGRVFASRIGFDTNSTFTDNYATPNFTITGDYNMDESDVDGETLQTNSDLEAILKGSGESNSSWLVKEGDCLPRLAAFDKEDQPATSYNRKDYLLPRLVLNDDLAVDGIIQVYYDEGKAEWRYYGSNNKSNPFNGEISGKTEHSKLYITGTDDPKSFPTLTIADDASIAFESNNDITFTKNINLVINSGKTLEVNGGNGILINSNAIVNLTQGKSDIKEIDGIKILSNGNGGIFNSGTLNIDVHNLTIEATGESSTCIDNVGTLNHKRGILILKAKARSIYNQKNASFTTDKESPSKLVFENEDANYGILNNGTMTLQGEALTCSIKGKTGIRNEGTGSFTVNDAHVTVEGTTSYSINNAGTFDIKGSGALHLISLEDQSAIINEKDAPGFKFASTATFTQRHTGEPEPAVHTLTYSDTKDASLSLYDKYGTFFPSGLQTNAGIDLFAVVSNNPRPVTSVTFTPSEGDPIVVTEAGDDGRYASRMPEAALTVTAQIKPEEKPEPPTPPVTVYYNVTLPAVEGVTTDPAAGSHPVESLDDFSFYLNLDPAYNQSVPVVTTSQGETLEPRTSDGAYLLRSVQEDISISISGIVKNPDPVANAPVEADAFSLRPCTGGLLVHTPSPVAIRIYTFGGRLMRSCDLPAGDTRIALAAGLYLVHADDKVVKVRL